MEAQIINEMKFYKELLSMIDTYFESKEISIDDLYTIDDKIISRPTYFRIKKIANGKPASGLTKNKLIELGKKLGFKVEPYFLLKK